MSDQTAAELADLRRLTMAGRGRGAPALVLMAVFGLAYGLAFLSLHIAMITGFERLQPSAFWRLFPLIFLGSHLAFLTALLWTGWRMFGPSRTRIARSAGAVWSGAFVGFATLTVTVLLFTRAEPPTDQVYAIYLIGPALLVLWGMAWWATALLTDRRWLLLVAIGSFTAALVVAWIGNAPMLPLAVALCLLGLAFAPAMALLLERRP